MNILKKVIFKIEAFLRPLNPPGDLGGEDVDYERIPFIIPAVINTHIYTPCKENSRPAKVRL